MYRDLGSPQSDQLEQFRCCSLQEDKIDVVAFSPLQLAQFRVAFLQLLSRGVLLTDHLHAAVTHVLVVGRDEDRLQRIEDRVRSLRLSDQRCYEKRIVNLRWLDECLAQGCLVEPQPEHLVSLH
jgi:hypothetical protein